MIWLERGRWALGCSGAKRCTKAAGRASTRPAAAYDYDTTSHDHVYFLLAVSPRFFCFTSVRTQRLPCPKCATAAAHPTTATPRLLTHIHMTGISHRDRPSEHQTCRERRDHQSSVIRREYQSEEQHLARHQPRSRRERGGRRAQRRGARRGRAAAMPSPRTRVWAYRARHHTARAR